MGGFEADYGANLIGATVARMRGVIATAPAVSPTTGSGLLVAGIRVGGDQELATSIAGPLDQPFLDWMAFEAFPFVDSPAADVQMSGDSVALSRVFDIKSMRKIEEINQELQLWIQEDGNAPSFAWTVAYSISVLLLLP